METIHSTWLTEIDVLMGTATAANPYTGITVYNPDTDLAAMVTAISTYGTATVIATLAADIDTLVVHYADAFYDQIYYELGPISAALYNANLVQSSAYAIANMLALQGATEAVTKASIPLYAAAASEYVASPGNIMHSTIDVNKMKIIAKSEQTEKQLEIEIHEVTWPLDVYTYAGNMLASIGGGHGGNAIPKPSKTQSALGGAMAGASVGTAILPGYGTAIGAVVGGIAGYMNG
jgi:hypothetical protein